MPKAAFASLALVALAASGMAQNLKIEKYKLANGMTVILQEDHSLPIATINTWFKVGSKDEPDHRSGFAHLYEHLMFMGTFRIPTGDFDRKMEAAGGSNNASTAEDRTNYFSTGPSNILPLLLYLDADRLEDLGKAMTKEKVDLQRQVVLNERRQTTENTPYGKAYEAIPALMFPKGHPYSWSVIGSPTDLNAAQTEDVKAFFATFYVPRNASLVVAGDFDPKTIKPLIAKWFGTLPSGAPVPRRTVPPVMRLGVKRVTLDDQVSVPKTIEVWHSPKAGTKADLALQIAGRILADGNGTRLYDRLITKDQVASEVSLFQNSLALGSLLYLDATAAEGASQDALETAADEEIARFAKEGPTKEELARAVAKSEAGVLNGLQDLGNRADLLNSWEYYYGKPDSLGRYLKELRSLTPADVRDAVRTVAKPGDRLILRVVPQKGGLNALGSQDDKLLVSAQGASPAENPRGKIPTPEAPRPFAPPTPSVFKLSNGIEVHYVSRPELPLMSVIFAERRGADVDSPDKRGRAALTTDAMSDGAGKLSATEFRAKLDLLGASFGVGVDYQSTTASLNVPARNFGAALTLAASAIKEPRFDASEVDRERRLALDAIARRSDEPSLVARIVAMRELFGANTLYGSTISGEKETVAKLTPEDLRQAHAAIFRSDSLAVFVAGSLPEKDVRAALEREFAGWATPKGIAEFSIPATAPTGTAPRLIIVDRPGAVQTVISILAPSVPYADASRTGLEGFSTILGGSFTSRLNQNLREDKGYTYGAGQSFVFGRDLGYGGVRTSVRADVTGASLKEILKELDRIRGGDVTSAEATKAGSLLRQGTVEELASVGGVARTYANQWLLGAPSDALTRDLTGYGRIDASGTNALAKTAFAFDRAVIVLVGDRKTIEAQIKDLPLPKVEVLQP